MCIRDRFIIKGSNDSNDSNDPNDANNLRWLGVDPNAPSKVALVKHVYAKHFTTKASDTKGKYQFKVVSDQTLCLSSDPNTQTVQTGPCANTGNTMWTLEYGDSANKPVGHLCQGKLCISKAKDGSLTMGTTDTTKINLQPDYNICPDMAKSSKPMNGFNMKGFDYTQYFRAGAGKVQIRGKGWDYTMLKKGKTVCAAHQCTGLNKTNVFCYDRVHDSCMWPDPKKVDADLFGMPASKTC